MFRSTKKLEKDPPSVMTMQEIQEDLQTFKINPKLVNRPQFVSDLKVKSTEEISSQTLPEWWDGFEINELQIKDMESTSQKLQQFKQSLKEQAAEIEQQKSALVDEIEENLRKIQKLKTPE